MPPKTAAKLRGIITLLGDLPNRTATASMMGMNMTTTGMLFRKPLITRTTTRVIKIVSAALPRPADSTSRAPLSSTPARTMPWPTTNNAKTVTKAGFAKPSTSRSELKRLLPSGP